mgnify:CR=1 FL=1
MFKTIDVYEISKRVKDELMNLYNKPCLGIDDVRNEYNFLYSIESALAKEGFKEDMIDELIDQLMNNPRFVDTYMDTWSKVLGHAIAERAFYDDYIFRSGSAQTLQRINELIDRISKANSREEITNAVRSYLQFVGCSSICIRNVEELLMKVPDRYLGNVRNELLKTLVELKSDILDDILSNVEQVQKK